MNLLDLLRARTASLVLALEIVLVVLIATQAARLIWIMAAPVKPASAPFETHRLNADLSVLASFDAFGVSRGGGTQGGSADESFRLFGVRSGGVGGGSAIIAGADGVQKSYSVGETIADGVTLASVFADHVELSRGGARSTLSFPEIQ